MIKQHLKVIHFPGHTWHIPMWDLAPAWHVGYSSNTYTTYQSTGFTFYP